MKRIYKTKFDSAHHIEKHKLCGATHGHTYHLEVTLDIEKDWYDFHDIKQNIECILKQYDHHDMGNMTCEKLIKELYDKIYQKLFTVSVPIKSISLKLFETENFGCEYP